MTSTFPMRIASTALLDIDLADTQALFDAVGRRWNGRHGASAVRIVDGLAARERLGSTGLGQGVAIPHARCSDITEPLVTFVRPAAPIDFDAPDGLPVTHLVVFVIPIDAVDQYLGLLADVARTLSSAEARDDFRRVVTAKEMARVFSTSQGLHFDTAFEPEAVSVALPDSVPTPSPIAA